MLSPEAVDSTELADLIQATYHICCKKRSMHSGPYTNFKTGHGFGLPKLGLGAKHMVSMAIICRPLKSCQNKLLCLP